MRTIKLTHEEIELILKALGIAENQFAIMRKKYIEEFVNVRGVANRNETISESDFMLNKENEFCNLLIDIKHGDKDV